MKVFVVGGDILIEPMFVKNGHELVDNADDAELLCFTGGSDVYPEYYRDRVHPTTRYNEERDRREYQVFKTYPDKLKVGICRGSQFLNVMSGGTLWQDVDKHAIGATHVCTYIDGGKYDYNWRAELELEVPEDWDEEEEGPFNPHRHKKYVHPGAGQLDYYHVTSTHHQMMRPNKDLSELWGFTHMSNYRDTGTQMRRRANFEVSPDVEIVYYPSTKSLCFQPHPEYGVKSCEELFFTCLKRAFG